MNIKEYFKQLSIVFLGILIAFWVSNIGEKHNERRTQNQVLLTILNELKDNSESAKITFHSLDTLYMNYNRIQNQDTSLGAITINYLGLQFKSIGYETAKFTGILKDVDYLLTSKIVENYESQTYLEEAEQLVVDELLVLIKNRNGTSNDIDYLLLQISNLKNHIKGFQTDQNILIEDLEAALNLKS